MDIIVIILGPQINQDLLKLSVFIYNIPIEVIKQSQYLGQFYYFINLEAVTIINTQSTVPKPQSRIFS